MIKYVIFDFDGTLADSQEVFIHSWNHLAKKNDFKEVQAGDFEILKKLSMKERSKMLNFPLYKIPVFIPQMYKEIKRYIHKINMFDGVKEMLQQLESKGYKTAIISSNSEENILMFLNQNQISTITGVHCASSIFGKDKMINKFLKDNHLTPSEVIYVGDEHRDVVASKKTGVKVIWVSWGYDSMEVVDQENPDYKVNAPSEIIDILSVS